MKFDGITFLHLIGLGCLGFLIAVLVKLPLEYAVGAGVALCVYSTIISFLDFRKTDQVIKAMAKEYSRQIQMLTEQFGELLQQNSSSQSTAKQSITTKTYKVLKPNIISWEDVKNNTYLHPYRKEIVESNNDTDYRGSRRRYPLIGQTIYMTYNKLFEEGMSLGRWALSADDGLFYPVWAELMPERTEYVRLYGHNISGRVDNYYFNTTTKEEFILLSMPEEVDFRKTYVLLRLPLDRSSKPFRYERTQ